MSSGKYFMYISNEIKNYCLDNDIFLLLIKDKISIY